MRSVRLSVVMADNVGEIGLAFSTNIGEMNELVACRSKSLGPFLVRHVAFVIYDEA